MLHMVFAGRGVPPPQNFDFNANTNFVTRSNRNATTRGSGPEQTCPDQQSWFGPRANMFRKAKIFRAPSKHVPKTEVETRFPLKETCFPLKETCFPLKETWFPFKETWLYLKETWFSLLIRDPPRLLVRAREGEGGLGSLRQVQFWTSKIQFLQVFKIYIFHRMHQCYTWFSQAASIEINLTNHMKLSLRLDFSMIVHKKTERKTLRRCQYSAKLLGGMPRYPWTRGYRMRIKMEHKNM